MAKRQALRVGDRIILLGSGLRHDLIGCTGTVLGFHYPSEPRFQHITLVRVSPDRNPHNRLMLPVEFVRINPVDMATRQLLRVAPPPSLPADWSRTVSWESVGWKPNLERYANVVSVMIAQLRYQRLRRT